MICPSLFQRCCQGREFLSLDLGCRAQFSLGLLVLSLGKILLCLTLLQNFLLVDGECLPQVVVDLPARRMVVRAGRVVARDGELIDVR